MSLFRRDYRQTRPKSKRSHLKNRLYSIGMFVFVVLSLSSGLGYRFYNQPKLDIDKIAPQTLTAPSSANVEDVKTTEERRREARSGASAVWVDDPVINEQIHQNLQQLFTKGNQIRENLGNFPFVKTSVLSTATQTYLRQAPEPQWQQVLRGLNKNSNLTGLNSAQQLAVKKLRTYRESNSSQAFAQLLKVIAQARQRYNISLKALSAMSKDNTQSVCTANARGISHQ